jgi:transketolase
MRTAFINELIVQARIHPEIFLVVADLGYSVVEPFAAEFPDRYLNAGIAEQNSTGLAAGLAAEGYHVFTYSIANFPTFRCAEQIRNDVAYHQLPVTVVSVGGGVSYGSLGYSHHAVQDYAALRTFPHMTIAAPGDPAEAKSCVDYLVKNPGPSYLRLGKAGEPNFHADALPGLTPGLFCPAIQETGKTARKIFLTTGATLGLALEAAKELGPEWSVRSLPLWSETVKEDIRKQIASLDTVVIVEEHLSAGGFASYVREAIGNDTALQGRIYSVALDARVCGLVGSQKFLRKEGGLTVDHLLQVTRNVSPK